MRLWHYEILPYLPTSQLIAQKRECDLIFKDYLNNKKTNHILINYVWEYNIDHLVSYYNLLKKEFKKRSFLFNDKTLDKVLEKNKYFIELIDKPFLYHHNDRYLLQNFCNLQEKFDRGQKDFGLEIYIQLKRYVFNDHSYGDKENVGGKINE